MMVLQFLIAFVGIVLALISFMSPSGWHNMTLLQSVALTTIFALAATLLALSLSWQMVPGSYQRISVEGLTAAVGIGFFVATTSLFPWHHSGSFIEEGIPCALTEFAIVVPIAAVFWLMARRGAPLSRSSLDAAVAGLAGLVALAILQVRCPHQEAPHLLVWHLGAVAIIVSLGILAGKTAA
jgi:hypothetical protein